MTDRRLDPQRLATAARTVEDAARLRSFAADPAIRRWFEATEKDFIEGMLGAKSDRDLLEGQIAVRLIRSLRGHMTAAIAAESHAMKILKEGSEDD